MSRFSATDVPKLNDNQDTVAARKSVYDLLDKINTVSNEWTADSKSTNAIIAPIGTIVSGGTLRSALINLTTNITSNIGNVILTAGTWSMFFLTMAENAAAGTSITVLRSGISLVSATQPASLDTIGFPTSGEVRTARSAPAYVSGNGAIHELLVNSWVTLTNTTTFYGVVNHTFTVAGLNAYGQIWAIRIK